MKAKIPNDSIKDIEKLINLMITTKTEYIKVGTTEIRLSQLALIQGLSDVSERGVESGVANGSLTNRSMVTDDQSDFHPPHIDDIDDDLLYLSAK